MRARKRFGQNFLIDHAVIDRILAAIAPDEDEHIVEIGPGRGALTDWLLRHAGQLSVVEIDRDLVSLLQRRFSQSKINIVSADALKIDFASLGDDLRIVGNLPYNISTPLLFHLAKSIDSIRDMHFMLQREVVDRIVATPGNKTYGRLSVMLQARFNVESLFDVSPSAFDPAPKVWSSIVQLEPLPSPLVIHSESALNTVVTNAFSKRRKTLRNALKSILGDEDIRRCDIDPSLRPEMLGVADFVRLANRFTEQ